MKPCGWVRANPHSACHICCGIDCGLARQESATQSCRRTQTDGFRSTEQHEAAYSQKQPRKHYAVEEKLVLPLQANRPELPWVVLKVLY